MSPTATVDRAGLHAALAAAMTEAELQRRVIGIARNLGWWFYHVPDSRRTTAGMPDLLLIRDRVLYRELKKQTGKLRAEQVRVISQLERAGADVRVWRPTDLFDGTIEKELL